jgi:hypothetical protein
MLVFKNDKGGNERRPDYRGELRTEEGKQYRFSLWINESAKGQKYLEGPVELLEEQPDTRARDMIAKAPAEEKSSADDIPF